MGADDTVPAMGTGQAHNRSAQQGVDINLDPVLDFSNEHHHPHVHHGPTAMPAEKDDLMFAKSTDNYPKDAPAPDYKVQQMSSNDEESGNVGDIRDEGEEGGGGRKWTFKRIYARHKILFHIAIWAVWTASVQRPLFFCSSSFAVRLPL